jgi:hypothetical protein
VPDDDGVGPVEVATPGTDAGTVVNYYFPVRVEVVGSLPDAEVSRVASYVFGELERELATRA